MRCAGNLHPYLIDSTGNKNLMPGTFIAGYIPWAREVHKTVRAKKQTNKINGRWGKNKPHTHLLLYSPPPPLF